MAHRGSPPSKARGAAVYRHALVTRLCHWINVVCLSILLMSGLQIFNAHPHLYWGQYGANADPQVLQIGARQTRGGIVYGVTRIGPLTVRTTGVLGWSKVDGNLQQRAFPAWITLPSHQDLASGRRWHFFFAWLFVINGAVYLTRTVFSRHLTRDLLLRREEARPRALLIDVWDHMRLKKPTGEAATRYNPLQKLAYLAVIFVLLPLMLLTGLTMTPGMDAAWPFLLDLFGGRQSARTLHFATANLLVLFVLIHLVEVLISGAWNEIRSMITGWWVIKPGKLEPENGA